MARYKTAEIYDQLIKKGYRNLRLLHGTHVIDGQNRMVAHYSCRIGEDSYWDLWDKPFEPMKEHQLKDAYPLEGDVLFQFSTIENDLKSKQEKLNECLSQINKTI